MAYLTASIAQLTADYEKEAELTQARADAYAELLDDLLTDVDAADSAKFDAFSALAQKVASALAAANAADATLATSAETQLATERSENETAYAAATAAADAAYETARRDAWNDAFLETLGESAAAQIEFDAITASTTDALNAAYETYRDAIFAANDDFEADALDLAEIHAYNQARIDQGGTVAADIFENPTFDYDVCFVAGTPVLMADGTTKPIEQIRPGDQVLAAHHLNPEEKPTAANVVRFFDNGEKDVVKLIFEGNQEIVCTPGHRFYVLGKGWVHAQDLQLGDLCLSATGGKVAFLSRENSQEKQRVYNFEVEKPHHTYFVGALYYILTHNQCPPPFIAPPAARNSQTYEVHQDCPGLVAAIKFLYFRLANGWQIQCKYAPAMGSRGVLPPEPDDGHNYILDSWNVAIEYKLTKNGYDCTEMLMRHSLDSSSELPKELTGALRSKIYESLEYKKLYDTVITDIKNIGSYSATKSCEIEFTQGDLFYGIYHATIVFDFEVKESQLYVSTTLKDVFDFKLEFLMYYKYKKSSFPTALANNIACWDQSTHHLRTFPISIEIEHNKPTGIMIYDQPQRPRF